MKGNNMMMSSMNLNNQKEEEVCAVCLVEINERSFKLYPCKKHKGHSDCIDLWVKTTQDDTINCVFRCPK